MNRSSTYDLQIRRPNFEVDTAPAAAIAMEETLPTELILSILTYLGEALVRENPIEHQKGPQYIQPIQFCKFISSYMAVNKNWQKHIEGLVWSQINEYTKNYDFMDFVSLKNANSFLEKYGSAVRTFSCLYEQSDTQMINMMEQCPNLEKIDLGESSITSGRSFNRVFPAMRYLELSDEKQTTYNDLFYLSKTFCNLTHLHLSLEDNVIEGFEFFDAIAQYFPHLRSLYMHFPNEGEDHNARWFSENSHRFDKIENLEFPWGYLNDGSLKDILTHFPKLKSLNLMVIDELSGEGLIGIKAQENEDAFSYTTLESLNMEDCGVSLQGLKEILTVFPNLNFINISNEGSGGESNECESISNAGLELLALHPNLKEIHISRQNDNGQGFIDRCCKLFSHLDRLIVKLSYEQRCIIEKGELKAIRSRR